MTDRTTLRQDSRQMSPVILRLIEEIRREREESSSQSPGSYNRAHNRHNRSGSYNRAYTRHMGS